MIKAPYNFVPLNETVFFPDWAHQVSHDIPFSDGENGWIRIMLTAKSPVYVRNGGSWSGDLQILNNDPQYQSFSHVDDRYFIPGTSVKGMIRSVLEILSFGKMGAQINRHRFSYRNLSNSDEGKAYRKKISGSENGAFKPKVKAGWLKEEADGSWTLTPCKFARVNFSDLKEYHGKRLGKRLDLSSKQSSVDKYTKWGSKPLDIIFNMEKEQNGNVKQMHLHSCGNLWYEKAIELGKGNLAGTLVFTGQATPRKHMEFIFHSPDKKKKITIPYDDPKKKDFLFIHSARNGEPNPEWKFWLNSGKLRSNGIPVFYLPENNGVHSMGLAMMYRLAYDNSVYDLLPEVHKNPDDQELIKYDLAEVIFGAISKEARKGRVQFSHAFAENAVPMDKTITTVLGGPKASYSPSYLQDGSSYRNSHAKLKGRKRYPVHPADSSIKLKTDAGTDNMSTSFTPLEKGAQFTCMIRFHNLRKTEIGALLSSLTFHGNESRFFHSLGMGKPLGYGKMQLQIEEIHSEKLNAENRNEYLDAFTSCLEGIVEKEEPGFVWRQQPQIDELLTMACEQKNQSNTDSELAYMNLSINPPYNEFVQEKNDQNCLKNYSELQNIKKESLKTAKDFVVEIEAALGEKNRVDAILQMPRSHMFLAALLEVMKAKEHSNSFNKLYGLIQYKPEIIIKRAGDLKNKELRRCISKIQSPNKSNPVIQRLFDYLCDKGIIDAETLPEWVMPIAYDWEDLQLTDDQLFDIIADPSTRSWPPIDTLQKFLEQQGKQDLLELL